LDLLLRGFFSMAAGDSSSLFPHGNAGSPFPPLLMPLSTYTTPPSLSFSALWIPSGGARPHTPESLRLELPPERRRCICPASATANASAWRALPPTHLPGERRCRRRMLSAPKKKTRFFIRNNEESPDLRAAVLNPVVL
jgi:hypothetical protein